MFSLISNAELKKDIDGLYKILHVFNTQKHRYLSMYVVDATETHEEGDQILGKDGVYTAALMTAIEQYIHPAIHHLNRLINSNGDNELLLDTDHVDIDHYLDCLMDITKGSFINGFLDENRKLIKKYSIFSREKTSE